MADYNPFNPFAAAPPASSPTKRGSSDAAASADSYNPFAVASPPAAAAAPASAAKSSPPKLAKAAPRAPYDENQRTAPAEEVAPRGSGPITLHVEVCMSRLLHASYASTVPILSPRLTAAPFGAAGG
jgi:hypothetical protein